MFFAVLKKIIILFCLGSQLGAMSIRTRSQLKNADAIASYFEEEDDAVLAIKSCVKDERARAVDYLTYKYFETKDSSRVLFLIEQGRLEEGIIFLHTLAELVKRCIVDEKVQENVSLLLITLFYSNDASLHLLGLEILREMLKALGSGSFWLRFFLEESMHNYSDNNSFFSLLFVSECLETGLFFDLGLKLLNEDFGERSNDRYRLLKKIARSINNRPLFKFKFNRQVSATELNNIFYEHEASDEVVGCCICLDDEYSATKEIYLLQCNHFLCSPCLMKMVKNDTRCPMCRNEFGCSYKKAKQINLTLL